MPYSKVCVAVALQRYLDFTPIAERLRDLAMLVAQADGIPLAVLSVEAPVELLPDVDTMGEKIARFSDPLEKAGLEVFAELRKGKPSKEIMNFVDEFGADCLIIGSHSKRGPFDVGLGSTASVLMNELRTTIIAVRPTEADQQRARELMIPRYPLVFPYG